MTIKTCLLWCPLVWHRKTVLFSSFVLRVYVKPWLLSPNLLSLDWMCAYSTPSNVTFLHGRMVRKMSYKNVRCTEVVVANILPGDCRIWHNIAGRWWDNHGYRGLGWACSSLWTVVCKEEDEERRESMAYRVRYIGEQIYGHRREAKNWFVCFDATVSFSRYEQY
jgi:hypothetical protein